MESFPEALVICLSVCVLLLLVVTDIVLYERLRGGAPAADLFGLALLFTHFNVMSCIDLVASVAVASSSPFFARTRLCCINTMNP